MEKSLLKNAAVLEETKNQLTKEGTRRKKWTKARVGEPRVKIIFEFTKQEEQTAIDSLKHGKVGDTKGQGRRPQRM